jgi:hypothetical protein
MSQLESDEEIIELTVANRPSPPTPLVPSIINARHETGLQVVAPCKIMNKVYLSIEVPSRRKLEPSQIPARVRRNGTGSGAYRATKFRNWRVRTALVLFDRNSK